MHHVKNGAVSAVSACGDAEQYMYAATPPLNATANPRAGGRRPASAKYQLPNMT
jgi:hypothetical protein